LKDLTPSLFPALLSSSPLPSFGSDSHLSQLLSTMTPPDIAEQCKFKSQRVAKLLELRLPLSHDDDDEDDDDDDDEDPSSMEERMTMTMTMTSMS
jgi:hypothetical protein